MRSLTVFGRRKAPISRFSSTDNDGKTLSRCGTYPIPCSTSSCASALEMSLPSNEHGTLADRQQAEQRLEERRLAGAVGTDDADQFAAPEFE